MESCGFPNVIGLIDCTHIAISGLPKETEYAFVNRKGYHSVNAQIVSKNCYHIFHEFIDCYKSGFMFFCRYAIIILLF